jgi:hypothetical protein
MYYVIFVFKVTMYYMLNKIVLQIIFTTNKLEDN